jgi:spore coat protein U-like protein
MIKFKHVAAVAAVAGLACGAAMADTANMAVTASVTGTCSLGTVNPLDFGPLNPVTAPALTNIPTTIEYKCTKGKTPATFTIGGQSGGSYSGTLTHTTMTAPKDTFAYSLSWNTTLPAGLGMATGKEVSVTVNGNIAAGVYANVTAGSYSESVPIVVSP